MDFVFFPSRHAAGGWIGTDMCGVGYSEANSMARGDSTDDAGGVWSGTTGKRSRGHAIGRDQIDTEAGVTEVGERDADMMSYARPVGANSRSVTVARQW